MKRQVILFLIAAAILFLTTNLVASGPTQQDITHVATALDHLTVLEFDEPVTMAAAGSTSFQIEWKDNKVFVKPLKANATTDLFVWTASRRFNYELQASSEVGGMNFAIDSRRPEPKPTPIPSMPIDDLQDTLLTRALLGSERVDSTYIKDRKGRVTVRIEQVFQSSNSLYIHYSIRNSGDRPYRILQPDLRQLIPFASKISLISLQNTQLDDGSINRLGAVKEAAVPITHWETTKQDLAPGEAARGVLIVRQHFPNQTVFEVSLGKEGGHDVRAVFAR